MSEMYDENNIYCIDDVPDELLLEIFNYFDGTSLKNLSLVCKKWSQIIGQSASTMRRLPLSTRRFFEGPGEIMRKYHSMTVEQLNDNEDISILEEIAQTCQELTIRNIIFRDSTVLRTIFYLMRLLRKMILVRVQLDSNDKIMPLDDVTLVITELQITQCDHRILNFFPKLQAHRLEIIDGHNKTDSQALCKFMSQQKVLESLTIENLADGSGALFGNYDSKFNFELKELSTLFSNIHDVDTFDRNFISFLKNHRESLKKLKVEGSLSQKIFKFVVSHFNGIQELEINVSELPQESSFYNLLKANLSLRTLKLNGTINKNNFNGVKGMLVHYKNIERISIADTDIFVVNDLFHVMSVRLVKLSHLSVLNLHESFTPDTIFPALKYFSIRILNNITQWKAFITRNEYLESLSVGWIKRDQFTVQIIQEIISLPNLHHLELGGRFIACKRIYEVIKRDYKNLRTLKLMVANYEEIKSLTFIFPVNKSLWLPQCLYFDEGSDREPLND